MTDVFKPYSSRFLHSSDKPDLPRPILSTANTGFIMANPSSAQHEERPRLSPPSARSVRKRAASINTEEAEGTKVQDMNLTTPTDAVARTVGAGRDSICLCKQAPKIPRPRNAFILYRQNHHADVTARHPGLSNPNISKIIAEQWRAESEEVQRSWKNLAEEEKLQHRRQYPDYRYQPRRGGKNSNAKQSSSATDDGRCSKCGGRFIATPRTPSTPLQAGQGEPLPTSHPSSASRLAENARNGRPSQVGSGAVVRHPQHFFLSGDGHREADKTYEPLSPSPDRKRRRLSNDVGTYQQTQHSTTQLNHAVSHHGPQTLLSAPPVFQSYGQQQLPVPRAMAPPPRPQLNPHGPSVRGPTLDNLLHLAPLQTPITPTSSSVDTSGRWFSPTETASNVGAGSQAKEAEDRIMSIPYLDRLTMLCKISPALPPSRPGSPKTKTRGALIAIEGPRPDMLRVVAEAVEKALSDSDEVALKIWGSDDRAPLPDERDVEMRDTLVGIVHAGVSRRCVSYLNRMTQWYERSNEIIQHMTTQSRSTSGDTVMCAHRTLPESSATASAELMPAIEPTKTPGPEAPVPVALVPTGFSLTLTDKFACATPIADSYVPAEHWRSMARFWQGIVGPDLFIYVKPSSDEEIKGFGPVRFKSDGIMVVRVGEGRGVSEKLQRRLAFEVLEWVRVGTYKTGGY